MGRRALVTGADGFLGRRLVMRLRAEGWAVVGAVRGASGRAPSGNVVLGPGPWTTEILAGVLETVAPDIVFHLAGSAWVEPVAALYETNLMLAARLLDATAARSPRPAVVLTGSAAEYGFVPEDRQPVREDFPCAPLTHHGIAKHAQTQLGLAWVRAGLQVLIVRLFNPVGAGMPQRLALAQFAAQIRSGAKVLQVGDLDVARDFIDVDEAARLIVALASQRHNFGQVVNICSGIAVQLRPLVQDLLRLADRPVDIVMDPARSRPGEMPNLRGDTGRLHAAGLSVQAPDFARVLRALLLGMDAHT